MDKLVGTFIANSSHSALRLQVVIPACLVKSAGSKLKNGVHLQPDATTQHLYMQEALAKRVVGRISIRRPENSCIEHRALHY